MEKEFLSVRDVAEILGVSYSQVIALIKNHELAAETEQRAVRYKIPTEAVSNYLEKKKQDVDQKIKKIQE